MGRSDVDAFMKWLGGYETWYDRHSDLWTYFAVACKIAALFASLTTFVVTAGMKSGDFDHWGKWAILTATALATASSEFMGQFKVREMEDLREDGDLEMKNIVAEARQRFAEAGSDEKRFSELMDDYRKRVLALEIRQHHSHSKIQARQHQFGKH